MMRLKAENLRLGMSTVEAFGREHVLQMLAWPGRVLCREPAGRAGAGAPLPCRVVLLLARGRSGRGLRVAGERGRRGEVSPRLRARRPAPPRLSGRALIGAVSRCLISVYAASPTILWACEPTSEGRDAAPPLHRPQSRGQPGQLPTSYSQSRRPPPRRPTLRAVQP